MSDATKHPDAIAWGKFEADNPDLFNADTLGATVRWNEYLKNRLRRAFEAGLVAAREEAERGE